MQEENSLKQELEGITGIDLRGEDIKESLATYINVLIKEDFSKLVHLLYRVDVNEEKLKRCLKENPDQDAGMIIAEMLINRQRVKMEGRRGSDNG